MIGVSALVLRLISDSQQGKIDARAAGLATAAESVYAFDVAVALDRRAKGGRDEGGPDAPGPRLRDELEEVCSPDSASNGSKRWQGRSRDRRRRRSDRDRAGVLPRNDVHEPDPTVAVSDLRRRRYGTSLSSGPQSGRSSARVVTSCSRRSTSAAGPIRSPPTATATSRSNGVRLPIRHPILHRLRRGRRAGHDASDRGRDIELGELQPDRRWVPSSSAFLILAFAFRGARLAGARGSTGPLPAGGSPAGEAATSQRRCRSSAATTLRRSAPSSTTCPPSWARRLRRALPGAGAPDRVDPPHRQ